MDLLQRLDWRVRLDPTAEVYPCCRLLFRMDAGGPQGMMPAGGGQPSSLRDAWAARMRRLVVTIAHKVRTLVLAAPDAGTPCDAAWPSPPAAAGSRQGELTSGPSRLPRPALQAQLLGKPAPPAQPSACCRLAEGYGREMAPKRQRTQA